MRNIYNIHLRSLFFWKMQRQESCTQVHTNASCDLARKSKIWCWCSNCSKRSWQSSRHLIFFLLGCRSLLPPRYHISCGKQWRWATPLRRLPSLFCSLLRSDRRRKHMSTDTLFIVGFVCLGLITLFTALVMRDWYRAAKYYPPIYMVLYRHANLMRCLLAPFADIDYVSCFRCRLTSI